jgi:S1-C subfamily serine protease
MKLGVNLLALALTYGLGVTANAAADKQKIDVSAPLLTYSAGKTGRTAFNAVVRVICRSKGVFGSGFIHPSGRVITAAHVISGCELKDLKVMAANGNVLDVTEAVADDGVDLAALKLSSDPKISPLFVSRQTEVSLGEQVAIWGFPLGYNGGAPLLTVGFVAGIDSIEIGHGRRSNRLIVNAAFNAGNSGGPIIDVEDGAVIGVVSSKLAPVPAEIEGALKALQENPSGMIYTGHKADGTEANFSEAQIVAGVLTYLRSQTQLVIGQAVTADDVHQFLKQKQLEK